MIQDIFKSSEAFAEKVQLQPLKDAIQSLSVQSEKITVAVIGRPFASPQSTVAAMLGTSEAVLNSFTRELTDVVTQIRLDTEGPAFKIWQEDGQAVRLDQEAFFEVLSGAYMRQMIINQIGLSAPLLKLVDIKLVISEDTFSSLHWDAIFAGVDFVVFAVNATMMFSAGERQFFKTKLMPRFGASGIVLAVNHMAMLRENERLDVLEAADYYCPKSEGFHICYDVPAATELSEKVPQANVLPAGVPSADVLQTNEPSADVLQANEPSADVMDMQTLAETLFTKNTNRIRLETLTRNAACCIAAVESQIMALKDAHAQDRDKTREAVEKMKQNAKMLEKRNSAEIRRLEMFIQGNVGVTLLDKINTFNELLKAELALGMSESADFREVGRRAAPFIERTWQTFFKNQEVWLKRRVYEEMEAVSKRFEANMSELISGSEPEITLLLKGFMSRRYQFDTIASEKIVSDNTSASISKYLAIGGIALLFVNIPLAAITVGTSKLIKYIYREDIQQNQMLKLKNYLFKDCDSLRDELYHRAESQMRELVKSLTDAAQTMHKEMMKALFDALQEQADRLEASDAMLAYAESYEKDILPTLKAQLKC